MTQHLSFTDEHGRWHCVNTFDIVHFHEYHESLAEDALPAGLIVYVRAPGYGHPGWEFRLPHVDMAAFERRLDQSSMRPSVSGRVRT